jgi:hypothetical protein
MYKEFICIDFLAAVKGQLFSRAIGNEIPCSSQRLTSRASYVQGLCAVTLVPLKSVRRFVSEPFTIFQVLM